MTYREGLSDGEIEILVDGLSDEVALVYVMGYLGLGYALDAAPSPERMEAIDSAIAPLGRLINLGLIQVGSTRYVDGGPQGRVSPYEFFPEPPAEVWSRLRERCLSAEPHALHYLCWCVNTATGDALARCYVQETDQE